MYAPRHLVFSLLHGAGPHLVDQPASAADAERVVESLSASGVPVLLAGPEQPRVESGWLAAQELRLGAGGFEIRSGPEEWLLLRFDLLASATLVESTAATRHRVLLLRWADDAPPVLLHTAHTLHSGPELFTSVLEACAATSALLRRRQLDLAAFTGLATDDTSLLLALAVVDRLQPPTSEWPRALAPRARPSVLVPTVPRRLATLVTWAWWMAAFPAAGAVLVLLGAGAWRWRWETLQAWSLAVVLAAWASQRASWSRWLERVPGLVTPRPPPWPLPTSEPGREPRAAGLLLECALAASAWLLRAADEPVGVIARAVGWSTPVLAALAALGWYELRAVREFQRPPAPLSGA